MTRTLDETFGYGGDGPAYYAPPRPAPVHAECGHARAYGHVCRLCAEPPPTLQDEARWRADDERWEREHGRGA